MTTFIEKLFSTRRDYDKETRRHRFLLDAYAGTGGFQGKERAPFAGYWGAAAELYARASLGLVLGAETDEDVETYLDRFMREDMPKFVKRAGRAHYPNYVAPSIDIPLSYMFRKPNVRAPDDMGALQLFLDDANGAGMTWDDMLRDVIMVRASVLGWCPVAFDIFGEDTIDPNTGKARERTALDDQREGRRPVAVPLFPGNLLKWQVDDTGVLQWVKLKQTRYESSDPLNDAKCITRITIWEPHRYRWWDVADDERGERVIIATKEGKNPFGVVPVLVARCKPLPDDPFMGIPRASAASDEARRLFNALSELDEHMRACAYGLLQIPIADASKVASVMGGNGIGIAVPPDSNRDVKWVTPDANVANMYEARVKNCIEEMHRMQNMDFVRGSKGGGQRSGVSQSFEFESMNRTIAGMARQMAMFEQGSLRLVGSVMVGAPKREAIRCTPATRFDVQEMASVLEEAMTAISLKLGARASAEIRKRVAAQMLPNIEPEVLREVYAEIDAQAEDEEQNRKDADASLAAARAALAAGGEDEGEDDEETDDGVVDGEDE